MIQVLLAEDHNIVRNGIKMLLEVDQAINIVGEAVNGKEVLDIISDGEKVDIVLTDINMPELDGISLLKEMKSLWPETKIVILSMHDNEKYVTQAFQEGASAYLLKSVNADELIFSLRHVNNGGKYLCSELVMQLLGRIIEGSNSTLPNSDEKIDFSMREIEVLQLIVDGFTNIEMADKLFISKRTVEGHRQSLIEKTGVRNTAALVRYAFSNGIVQ